MLSGVQGGKTTAGAAWELLRWQAEPKGDHLILAPTYKILQQSTLRKLDALMPRGWAEFNKQESCYNLAGGGKAFVRSTEDPDAMEGITASDVWMDEAGMMAVKACANAQARRSATQGPVFLTTTPYGTNWLKTDFFDKSRRGLPEYRTVHFRSIDSPHFPKAEWDRAQRDMTPAAFARKFGGEFTRLEGLVYEDFDRVKHGLDMPSVPRHWERIGGLDFGWSEGHPFAASVWASAGFRDPRHKVVKVAEHKKHGLLLQQHLQVMRNLEARVGRVSVWYADPSAAQQIAELKRLAEQSGNPITIKSANNAVEWGIECVVALMRNDRYRIVAKWCPETIDELETYHRDEEGRIVKEADHLLDADRYCLATHLLPPRTVRVI